MASSMRILVANDLQNQLASFNHKSSQLKTPEKPRMITFQPRLWTMMGLSAVALASLSACGEGGEAGGNTVGTNAVSSAKAGEGEGEGAPPPAPAATPAQAASGEAGEAGAQNAYSDVSPSSHLGLRIAHVTGFVLMAQKIYAAGQAEEASVLISQGLLEVYAPNATALDTGAPGLKAAFDKIIAAIDAKKPKAEVDAAFTDAMKVARDAEIASGAAPKDIVGGMLSIAAGLYSGVVTPQGNDPIEYQHAQGAVLGAKAAFDASKAKLTGQNAARTQTLGQDIDALLALFPSTSLPEKPASVADVTGAASRAQLALSGIE
jgi:hypothetical protein